MNLHEMIGNDRLQRGEWWGQAWTLTRGCTAVSPECAHCWAETMSHQRKDGPAAATYGMTTPGGLWTGIAEPLERHLEKPLHRRIPTVYSVWNDLFHEDIDDSFITDAFGVMEACPHHFFVVCTKRHDRQLAYALAEAKRLREWPLPNVMCMVTAGTQESADLRIPALLAAPWAYRGVSCEPLLGPVDASLYLDTFIHEDELDITNPCPQPDPWAALGFPMHDPWCRGLDLVITGCESGTDRRHADSAWFHSLRTQCHAAEVPFFLKQMEINGRVVKAPLLDGRQWLELPEVK